MRLSPSNAQVTMLDEVGLSARGLQPIRRATITTKTRDGRDGPRHRRALGVRWASHGRVEVWARLLRGVPGVWFLIFWFNDHASRITHHTPSSSKHTDSAYLEVQRESSRLEDLKLADPIMLQVPV